MVYASPWRAKRWLVLLSAALGLPAAALTVPADAVVEAIHPGAYSFTLHRPDGPYAIYGYVWDRAQPALGLRVTIGRDTVRGLEPTSSQIQRLVTDHSLPVAAVNGDFYIMSGPGQGATIGLNIADGELLGLTADRAAFLVAPDGDLSVANTSATVRLSGEGFEAQADRVNNSRGPSGLTLYTPRWAASTDTGPDGVEVTARWVEPGVTRLTPNLSTTIEITAPPVRGVGNQTIPADGLVLSGSGAAAEKLAALAVGQKLTLTAPVVPDQPIAEAVGGSDILLRDGQIVFPGGANEPRHPRTAIGFDRQQAMAVVIDGRRAGHSIGMTLTEVAKLLAAFGCRDGINLDGGGSSTCWVRGVILNRPSDGRERPVANALALINREGVGRAAKLVVEPAGPWRLTPGATVPFTVKVTDAAMNPLHDAAVESTHLDRPLGSVAGSVLTAGGLPGRGTLTARAGGLNQDIEVEVVDRLAKLEADPSRIELLAGATAAVELSGRDREGRLVRLAPSMLRWSLPAAVGRLEGGTVVGGQAASRGDLTVEGFGARLTVPVSVAGPVAIEDFGGAYHPVFEGFPEQVKGTAETTFDGQNPIGRLTYQLGTEPATRAAYMRFDRRIDPALALRARLRGSSQPVWVRLALVDGNDQRQTFDLFQGTLGGDWQEVEAVLDPGLKAPLRLQSIYVVATDAKAPTDGWIEIDDVTVLRAR